MDAQKTGKLMERVDMMVNDLFTKPIEGVSQQEFDSALKNGDIQPHEIAERFRIKVHEYVNNQYRR